MSRLYGRTDDVYSISKYFVENYNKKYIKDNTIIKPEELENAPCIITPYISNTNAKYIDSKEIEIACNPFIKETIYSGLGEEKNVIIYPSRKLKEEYKRELIYFIGDLLRRKSLDYLPEEFDIKCQYSDVLPLLIEYLYLKETGKEERFSEKHLSDLRLNAPMYIKLFENYDGRYENPYDKEKFLRNTLLFLVPLSSMDATLQINDTISSKDELIELIDELINNEKHNREAILKRKNIDTYGFKRLRKEIEGRK